MKRAVRLLSAVLAVALSGCGNGTSTLTGKVSYRGRPVASGSIIVLQDGGTARSGIIQPDGTYSVSGVERGHVRVGVISPNPAHTRSVLTVEANRARVGQKRTHAAAYRPNNSGWFQLPRDLGDPATSGLECDVAATQVAHHTNVQ